HPAMNTGNSIAPSTVTPDFLIVSSIAAVLQVSSPGPPRTTGGYSIRRRSQNVTPGRKPGRRVAGAAHFGGGEWVLSVRWTRSFMAAGALLVAGCAQGCFGRQLKLVGGGGGRCVARRGGAVVFCPRALRPMIPGSHVILSVMVAG